MDPRKLKAEAAESAAKGKHKKALDKYLELERIEPREGGWARRAGEMYRQLGRVDDGIAAFERSADKYAAAGLVAKASAVCQTILRMRPGHADARARLDTLVPNAVRPGAARPQSVSDLTREEQSPAPPAARSRPTPAAEAGLRVKPSGSVPPPVPSAAKAPDGRARPAPEAPTPPPVAAIEELEVVEELGAELVEEIELAEEPARADPQDQALQDQNPIDLEIEAEPGDDFDFDPSLADEPFEAAADISAKPAPAGLDEAPARELAPSGMPARPPVERDEVLREVLAASPLFSAFNPEEARALVERFEVIEVEAGEVLVEAGVLADRLLVIARGELILGSGGTDEDAPIGAVLGSISLISRAPEPVTARAKTRCVALALPSSTFRELIMTHPMLLAQLS